MLRKDIAVRMMILTYLILEIKRGLKRLPYMYLGAVMLFLLAGTMALAGGRMLYGDAAVSRIRVGVALPGDDSVAGQVVRFLEGMSSVKSTCDFVYLDLDEAFHELDRGELFAVLEVPDGFVKDIITGVNTPVTVWLPSGSELEGRLFAALTDAGARTLGASQAGIYAGNELYAEAGAVEEIPRLEDDLNRYYLSFSLSRMDYFDRQEISGTGDLDIPHFYAVSAFILFLFLIAVPAGEYLLPCGDSLRLKLDAAGVGAGIRVISKAVGLWILLAAVSLPPAAAAVGFGFVEGGPLFWFSWLLAVAAVSVLVLFFYSLAGTLLGGLLLLFLVTVLQHFLAGGFLPEVFLPAPVRAVSLYMPSGILMKLAEAGVSGQVRWMVVLKAAALMIAGLAADIWAERRMP